MGSKLGNTMPDTFGGLLKYYREDEGMTQNELGQYIGVSSSYIAMLETGIRKLVGDRPRKRTEELSKKLNLKAFDRALFFRAAGLAAETDLPNRRTVALLPDEEAYLQQTKPPDEHWIVARKSLEEGPLFDVTLENIKGRLDKDTKYVFFQPAGDPLLRLVERFRIGISAEEQRQGLIEKKIECIVGPAGFFTSSYAISNPGKSDMAGKFSLFENGELAYVYEMDDKDLEFCYNAVRPIYDMVKQLGTYKCGPDGRFQQIFP